VEALDDPDAAMAWFADEHQGLVAAVNHAGAHGYDEYACHLPWALATYFDRQGHWDDWVGIGRVSVEAARRLGDRAAQAESHRLLAGACSNLGDGANQRYMYDEAQTNLLAALDLFAATGDDHGRAHAHFDLAMLLDRQGQPRRALPHAEESLALYERVGGPIQQAVALNATGWYHTRLGHHEAAIAYCERALALSESAGSRYGQANTWDSLGFAHHQLGHHDCAIACYERALALLVEIGDRHAEGIVRDHLGDTWQAAGDRAAARESWTQALDILEQVGHADAETVRGKLGEISVADPDVGSGRPPS
jgi:tetratricopeptide (TPR) repeat protein